MHSLCWASGALLGGALPDSGVSRVLGSGLCLPHSLFSLYLCPVLASLRGHVAAVYQIAWSADSRLLVSGSSDSTLKVWDVKAQKLSTDLPGHADEVRPTLWAERGLKPVPDPNPAHCTTVPLPFRYTLSTGVPMAREWPVVGRTSASGCEFRGVGGAVAAGVLGSPALALVVIPRGRELHGLSTCPGSPPSWAPGTVRCLPFLSWGPHPIPCLCSQMEEMRSPPGLWDPHLDSASARCLL